MATSRIVELSQRIAVNTAKVHDYLAAHNLPDPSFEVDAPLVSVVPQANTDLAKARHEVINDTLELRQLMLGPREHLTSFSVCIGILSLCVEYQAICPVHQGRALIRQRERECTPADIHLPQWSRSWRLRILSTQRDNADNEN